MIKTLLQPEILDGTITIDNEEAFDVQFSLTPPLLSFAQGVMFEDGDHQIKIMIATEQGQHEIPWDGKRVISSIEHSSVFKQQVLKTHTATRFCNTNAAILKHLNRCSCIDPILSEKRLIGFDLSYPEIPRKRGVLIAGKCSQGCGYWSVRAFDVDTRHINERNMLITFLKNVCQSEALHLPAWESIIDESSQVHTFYAVGSSKRQREATKNKVTSLKGVSTLDELKRRY